MADNVDLMNKMLSTLKSIDKQLGRNTGGMSGVNSAAASAVSSASGLSTETQSAADNVNRFIASLDEAAVRFRENNKVVGLLGTTFDQIDKATGRIISKIGDKTGITKMLKGVKNIGSGIVEWGVALAKAEGFFGRIYVVVDGISSLLSNTIGFVGKIASGFLNLGKVLANSVVTVLSTALTTATKFAEFAVTLPIEIAKKASELGGQLRSELVVVIGQAVENTKELFDSASNSGDAFRQLGGIAKGSLLAFQDVGSSMVKLFGYGAEGAARMISEVTKNIADMGVFSEVFADSTTKNAKSIEFLTRMTKGLGLQSADFNYVVAEAMKNGEHYFETLTRMKENMDSVSTEFGVNRKRLSANFFELRKDITQFGHLTDVQLQRTAASAMQLGIEMKDVSAVFNKFSTFEDAANSAALLQQTFGMNIDALQLIRAEDPMEIIEMFRQSMLMTGRSFDDLNRHEKSLMAQHTGMSAEALKQIMNYRTLGKSYEDIKKIMKDQKPEERQLRAMRDMTTSMSEIQKIMDKKDFFNAFLDGFSKSIMYGTKFGKAMAGVNKAMETFYTEGLKVDKKLVNKITEPFAGILDEITAIFSVKGLRSLVNEILLNLSDFVKDITNPDKCFKDATIAIKWRDKIEGLFNFEALLANEGFLGKLTSVTGKIIGFLLKGMAYLGPGLIRGFGNALKSVVKFFKTGKIDEAFDGKSLGKFLGLDEDCWEGLKADIEFAFKDIWRYLFGGKEKKMFGNITWEVETKGLFSELKDQIFDGKGSMFDGLGKRLSDTIKEAFDFDKDEDLFTSIGEKIIDGMSKSLDKIKVLSKTIVEGIIEGLKSTKEVLWDEFLKPLLVKIKNWWEGKAVPSTVKVGDKKAHTGSGQTPSASETALGLMTGNLGRAARGRADASEVTNTSLEAEGDILTRTGVRAVARAPSAAITAVAKKAQGSVAGRLATGAAKLAGGGLLAKALNGLGAVAGGLTEGVSGYSNLQAAGAVLNVMLEEGLISPQQADKMMKEAIKDQLANSAASMATGATAAGVTTVGSGGWGAFFSTLSYAAGSYVGSTAADWVGYETGQDSVLESLGDAGIDENTIENIQAGMLRIAEAYEVMEAMSDSDNSSEGGSFGFGMVGLSGKNMNESLFKSESTNQLSSLPSGHPLKKLSELAGEGGALERKDIEKLIDQVDDGNKEAISLMKSLSDYFSTNNQQVIVTVDGYALGAHLTTIQQQQVADPSKNPGKDTSSPGSNRGSLTNTPSTAP